MKRIAWILKLIAITLIIVLGYTFVPSGQEHMESVSDTTQVYWFGEDKPVEGTESTLVRMEHGIYATFRTDELEPGAAYSWWWVVFNSPENCSDGVCGSDDLYMVDETGATLTDNSGAPQANRMQREMAQIAFIAGSGAIADVDGTADFYSHLPVGDTLQASWGPGLLDPMGAVVHIVIRYHGQVIPGQMHNQLSTEWGGCAQGWPKTPCRNIQIAWHDPVSVP